MIAVKATALEKHFGTFIAVNAVSFEVEKGEIYGFLGANGAGKTTTIRMLCGLLTPTSGEATVAGFSIKTQPEEIKKRIGYMSQKFSLYSQLTVMENINFYSGIYGLENNVIKERAAEVIKQIELTGYENRLVEDLPGGLKQRVALACAISHKPEVLFLDEPTAGVDPLLRRRFWEIIAELAGNGTTVFVTTHYMDEVEHCHRVALMHSGKIIKQGSIRDIKNSVFKKQIIEIETDTPVEAYKILAARKNETGEVSMHGALLHIIQPEDKDFSIQKIEALLKTNGISTHLPEYVDPTMEDVFVNIVKKYEKDSKEQEAHEN
ncbi:MAG: ABC transporter ATP-binding protein [bacterium]